MKILDFSKDTLQHFAHTLSPFNKQKLKTNQANKQTGKSVQTTGNLHIFNCQTFYFSRL